MSYYGKRLCCRCHLVPRSGTSYCKPCRALWRKEKIEHDPEFLSKANIRRRRWYRANLQHARKCARKAMAERRHADPQPSRDAVRRYHRKRNAESKALILEWKRNHPCADCGERDPVVLDAHHRNPQTKNFRLGAYTRETPEAVKHELAKCISLCANCHRRRHARS